MHEPAAERVPPRVAVEGATVRFGDSYALRGVSVDLQGPGIVQVLGPNGAGKTTLLRLIAGLVKPETGRVVVDGVNVTGDPGRAGRLVAYTPQLASRPPRVPVTPLDLLETSLRARKLRGYRSRAREALKAVGLEPGLWGRPLYTLSGGQLQRVLLARALASGARVLLLDEPLSAVDPRGRGEIAGLIAREAGERLVVASSHDPTLLLAATRWIVVMDSGRVAAQGPPGEVLVPERLAQTYGGSLSVHGGHVHLGDSHAPGGAGGP